MKRILILLLILLPVISIAQQGSVRISGYVQNEFNEALDGITIFNEQSGEITVTTSTGNFKINSKAGDHLIFNVTNYEPVTIITTQKTIEEKVISVTFGEGFIILKEVLLENDQNVQIGLEKTETPDPRAELVSGYNFWTPAVDRTENTLSDMERKPDEYELREEAFMQSQPRFNSFSLLSLLGAVILNVALDNINFDFGGANTQQDRFDVAVLKNEFDTDYLVEYLDIEKEQLYDFMYFAKDQGLNGTYFEPQNELVLLQFLSDTAQVYKNRKQ